MVGRPVAVHDAWFRVSSKPAGGRGGVHLVMVGLWEIIAFNIQSMSHTQ
jgi:hypothetical protein